MLPIGMATLTTMVSLIQFLHLVLVHLQFGMPLQVRWFGIVKMNLNNVLQAFTRTTLMQATAIIHLKTEVMIKVLNRKPSPLVKY